MATLTVLRKYAKNLRSSLTSYPARFSLIALILLFALFQSGTLLPVSAQNPALLSTSQSVPRVEPPGGTVATTVQVPASMQTSPFNVAHTLNIPPGFTISVYARINNARFMAVTPSGDLLVSQPEAGSVSLIRPNATLGGDPVVSTFVSGLSSPQDMAFQTVGSTTYFYLSESNKIDRYTYTYGAATPSNRVQLITGLPDATSVGGGYNHPTKDFAIGPDGKIYVQIGSRSNADPSQDPPTSDPVRGSVYRFNVDGTGKTLFARGLRNAEGLAFIPGTNTLWAAVNNRDDIACPSASAGFGCTSAGQTGVTNYINNHPPEEFTQVNSGANYGWPYCNPNPDSGSGYDNMPFDRDYQNNPTGSALDCTNSTTRINKGILAHSAPLGLIFLQDTAFPSLYRNGAVIGLHGSWDSTESHGYKVIYFPWNTTTQMPGNQIDLVSGWLTGNNQYWGRPVDTVVGLDGSMFISDDYSGTIYKMTPTVAATTNVTKATDDGSAGTFTYALNHAVSGDTITFDPFLNAGARTTPLILTAPGLLPPVPTGITVNGGSCMSGARVTIDGTEVTGNGLTMNGGSTLMNVKIQNFSVRQLVTIPTNGSNILSRCVAVKE